MYTIPFFYIENHQLVVDVYSTTKEKLIEYLNDNTIMPKALISAVFTKNYLDKRNLHYDFETVTISDSKLFPQHLPVDQVKDILKTFDIDPQSFLKEYNDYLFQLLK